MELQITSVTTPSPGFYRLEFQEGEAQLIEEGGDNPCNDLFDEWVAAGNTPAPYVAPAEPPPLTTEQKVNNLLSDYGLTRDEMQSALLAKESTMPVEEKETITQDIIEENNESTSD